MKVLFMFPCNQEEFYTEDWGMERHWLSKYLSRLSSAYEGNLNVEVKTRIFLIDEDNVDVTIIFNSLINSSIAKSLGRDNYYVAYLSRTVHDYTKNGKSISSIDFNNEILGGIK